MKKLKVGDYAKINKKYLENFTTEGITSEYAKGKLGKRIKVKRIEPDGVVNMQGDFYFLEELTKCVI